MDSQKPLLKKSKKLFMNRGGLGDNVDEEVFDRFFTDPYKVIRNDCSGILLVVVLYFLSMLSV